MNELLAIEFARFRMRELGIGDNYTIRVRHLYIKTGESQTIKAGKDVLIFYNLASFQRIQSRAGFYDMTFPDSNEMQYVHSGEVTLTNLNESSPTSFIFLQVIPNYQK